MSTTVSYVSEPVPSAVVIVHTSIGQLQIELWARECPLASRAFIQRALNGAYNNTTFARVIKGAYAETANTLTPPSATANPARIESNSRIRFNRRGLIALRINTSAPTNQWIITLSRGDDLHNNYTLFGRVIGDTIYTVAAINDAQVDEDNRPHNPIRITHIAVTLNPFDDIRTQNIAATDDTSNRSKRSRHQVVARREKNVLSFAADDDDFATDNDKDDRTIKRHSNGVNQAIDGNNNEKPSLQTDTTPPGASTNGHAIDQSQADLLANSNESAAAESIKQQAATSSASSNSLSAPPAVSAVETRRQRYLSRSQQLKQNDSREAATLSKLSLFQRALQADETDNDWMKHKLAFARRPTDYQATAQDDDYTFYDPKAVKTNRTEQTRHR